MKLDEQGTLFSPSKSQDGFKNEPRPRNPAESLLIKDMELIPWGGRYKNTTFLNTCSFDCVMQFLYYLYYYTKPGKSFIDDMIKSSKETAVGINLPKILSCISEKKFSKAKKIWVTELIGKDLPEGDLDLEEEEMVFGIMPLKCWFPISVTTLCPNPLCKRNKEQTKIRDSTCILKKTQAEFLKQLSEGNIDECSKCNCKSSHVFFGPVPEHSYGIFAYCQIGISRKYKRNPNYNPKNPNSSQFFVAEQHPNSLDVELLDIVEMFGQKFKVCF